MNQKPGLEPGFFFTDELHNGLPAHVSFSAGKSRRHPECGAHSECAP
jgi:hypothetical protein